MTEQEPEDSLNEQQLPEDPEHLSLDDMFSNFDDSDDEDYSLEQLSQAYAQILAEQDSLDLPAVSGDTSAETSDQDTDPSDDGQNSDENDGLSEEFGDGLSDNELAPDLTITVSPQPAFLQPLSIETANQDLQSDETINVTPERIVEAILFVGTPEGDWISARMLASLMRGVSPDEVESYVEKLNRGYEADQSAYRIDKNDIGFRLQLHRSMIPVRNQFYGQVKEAKLSQQIIDVLSVVAYHQPVERQEVERLVGRPCGGNINQLIRRDLIIIERVEKQKMLRTTARFLELFGLDEIGDLPQSEAMDDFE